MAISILEQVKIQARMLVPLVKALQAELGEERANRIVRNALGDMFRELGEKFWRAQRAPNLGANMASAFEKFSAGGALDYDVQKQSVDAFEVNVTGCRYAQFYKELGAPELGFLLFGDGGRECAPGGRTGPGGTAGAGQGTEGGGQQGKLAPCWGGCGPGHGDPLLACSMLRATSLSSCRFPDQGGGRRQSVKKT